MSDLISLPIRKFAAFAAFGLLMTIALVGVGTGRTLERSSTAGYSAPQSPLPSELLHEIIPAVESHTVAVATPKHGQHIVMMEVTAYCPCKKCCGPNAAGITASGKPVSYNDGQFVAADTTVLPFGSKLIIPGYSDQAVEVIDRGSAIKGNHLDVFFPTHEQALEWGRRIVPVTVQD